MEVKDENINGILNEIANYREGLTWEKQGIYSDGQTQLVQIAFMYTSTRIRKIGTIVYRNDTGKVINYHYKGFPREKGKKSIIDLLLEILSFERSRE